MVEHEVDSELLQKLKGSEVLHQVGMRTIMDIEGHIFLQHFIRPGGMAVKKKKNNLGFL